MSLAEAVRDMEEFRAATNQAYSIVIRIDDRKPESLPYASPRCVSSRQVERPNTNPTPTTTPASSWKNNKPNDGGGSTFKTSTWVFNDPEVKRQRRVAKYKSYAVEGRMKASLRSGCRWIKNKYCAFVHGY